MTHCGCFLIWLLEYLYWLHLSCNAPGLSLVTSCSASRQAERQRKGRGRVLLTLPRSSSSWHLLRQSVLLVNSTRAFSAWCRTAVSVVSYSCLHRISSWARPCAHTHKHTYRHIRERCIWFLEENSIPNIKYYDQVVNN